MQVVILRDCVSGPDDHYSAYESGQHVDLPDAHALSMIRAGHAKPDRDDEKPAKATKVERTVRRNRKNETR